MQSRGVLVSDAWGMPPPPPQKKERHVQLPTQTPAQAPMQMLAQPLMPAEPIRLSHAHAQAHAPVRYEELISLKDLKRSLYEEEYGSSSVSSSPPCTGVHMQNHGPLMWGGAFCLLLILFFVIMLISQSVQLGKLNKKLHHLSMMHYIKGLPPM